MEKCGPGKKKVILFGVGKGIEMLPEYRQWDVVCLTDNSQKADSSYEGNRIVPVARLADMDYDEIHILSGTGFEEIRTQLIELGISESKLIVPDYVSFPFKARLMFLKNFSKQVYKIGLSGSVAEAGVFRGEFAKHINHFFADRTLYLFDTFEGFDSRDINVEVELGGSAKSGHFNFTNEETVMSKMENPQCCVIKKGYFPETAKGISEMFCFVNLDMDLYQPTLEGLRYFENKMVDNGIILIHDYFSKNYLNVAKAVDQYLHESPHKAFPIGDSLSIAIVYGK